MKNKLKVKILSLLSLMMVTVTTAVPVSASQVIKDTVGGTLTINKQSSKGEQTLIPHDKLMKVDGDGLGSIVVSLTAGADGTKLDGVQFSCVKVGDVVNGEYVLDSQYKTVDVDLDYIKSAEDMEAASNKLAEVASTGTISTTDTAGKVVFKDLKVGLYLIKATDTSTYDDVTPLLVSIPTWSEDDGDMVYELNVIPKHEAKPKTPCNPVPNCKYYGTCKYAPQTNVQSVLPFCLGGASVLLVLMVVLNVFWKRKER